MDVTILLKLKLPIFECFVKIDKNKLGQVIRNLISNSLKFCSKPGVVDIKVDVISADNYADIVNSETSEKSVTNDTVKSTSNINNVKVFKKKNTVYAVNSDEDVPDMKYYLRVSVQDDGAGISEVKHYVVYAYDPSSYQKSHLLFTQIQNLNILFSLY